MKNGFIVLVMAVLFALAGCQSEGSKAGPTSSKEGAQPEPEPEYVVNGRLVVNEVILSPADLFVDSAFEVNDGLWEFEVQGRSYRVLEGSPNVVVYVPASNRVTLFLVSGQSLAMGSSSGDTLDPAEEISGFTGQMLMPAGFNSQGAGDRLLNSESISGLAYLKNNSGSSTSPATSAVYHALKMGLDASILVLSHGVDGKQIEYLRDGNSLKNAAVQLQAARALIESYGLAVDDLVPMVWNQGESDGTDSNYYDDLNGLFNLYEGLITTHLGDDYAMAFLIDQVSRFYTLRPALAQYQVCESRDDCAMALTKAHMQTKYNMAIETGSADYTHMSKRGYFYMGAYWGKAVHGLLSQGGFNPLDKRAITIEGNKIHIDFNVGESSLVFDSLVDVANLGFSYTDSLGNGIESAEMVGFDRVTLTMSEDVSLADSRVLGLGREVEAQGQYTGSPLRTSSLFFIPELSEYLHDWAVCWEVEI